MSRRVLEVTRRVSIDAGSPPTSDLPWTLAFYGTSALAFVLMLWFTVSVLIQLETPAYAVVLLCLILAVLLMIPWCALHDKMRRSTERHLRHEIEHNNKWARYRQSDVDAAEDEAERMKAEKDVLQYQLTQKEAEEKLERLRAHRARIRRLFLRR